jgi:hypothetical protein
MNNVLEGMIWFFMVRQKLHNAFQGIVPPFAAHLLHVCTLTSRIACRSRHVSKKYGSIYDQGFHLRQTLWSLLEQVSDVFWLDRHF